MKKRKAKTTQVRVLKITRAIAVATATTKATMKIMTKNLTKALIKVGTKTTAVVEIAKA